MVTGTRNTILESHVDDGVKQWVTAHVEAALERVKIDMRAIVTEALQSHNGRTGEVVRSDGAGTSRGPQSPQFTRMTKIEFPKFGG